MKVELIRRKRGGPILHIDDKNEVHEFRLTPDQAAQLLEDLKAYRREHEAEWAGKLERNRMRAQAAEMYEKLGSMHTRILSAGWKPWFDTFIEYYGYRRGPFMLGVSAHWWLSDQEASRMSLLYEVQRAPASIRRQYEATQALFISGSVPVIINGFKEAIGDLLAITREDSAKGIALYVDNLPALPHLQLKFDGTPKYPQLGDFVFEDPSARAAQLRLSRSLTRMSYKMRNSKPWSAEP